MLVLLGTYAQAVFASAPVLDSVDKISVIAQNVDRGFDRELAIKIFRQLEKEVGTEDAEKLMIVATCESGWGNKINSNTNGSKDSGLFQINSIHGLGNEVHDPEKNTEYALKLFRESGLRPWKSSQQCWSKGISQLT